MRRSLPRIGTSRIVFTKRNGESRSRAPPGDEGLLEKGRGDGLGSPRRLLYTGDVARMDEEGYFYIVDRKKDLIKYKGHSVYPRELEAVLYTHPDVAVCAVVGKPDSTPGEIPKGYVVLKEGAKASEAELIKFVNERVARYKSIRAMELRAELPTSPMGKILKRSLRDAPYDDD